MLFVVVVAGKKKERFSLKFYGENKFEGNKANWNKKSHKSRNSLERPTEEENKKVPSSSSAAAAEAAKYQLFPVIVIICM